MCPCDVALLLCSRAASHSTHTAVLASTSKLLFLQFHGPLWRDQHRAHVISVQGLQIAPPISWDSTDPPLLAALSYIMTLVWDDQDKSRLVFSSGQGES